MKKFIHSIQMFVVLIFLCSLISCNKDKDNNDPVNSSTPLLSSITSYNDDGTMDETETFKYDTQGRLIENVYDDEDEYKVVIEYSASKVTVKEYDEGVLDYTSTYTLNSNSLAVSGISDEEETTTYTYDNNGYRQTSFEEDGNSTYRETYTVLNQNYVTITSEYLDQSSASLKVQDSKLLGKSYMMKTLARRMTTPNTLKSATNITSVYTTNYEFYTDKKNTIDYENMGIFFLGKQNNNPIKKEIETTSGWDEDYTYTYTYEYDAKGRITKMIYEDGDYDVYTYIE